MEIITFSTAYSNGNVVKNFSLEDMLHFGGSVSNEKSHEDGGDARGISFESVHIDMDE